MTAVEEIVEEVRRHDDEHMLLVTSFDGVLVDYRSHPGRVWLPASRKQLLTQVAGAPHTTLAVISGRRVADVRTRVGVDPRVFYIGLHGLEIEGPAFRRCADELIDRYGDRMHDIATDIVGTEAAASGIRFEDKGAAVAVHTRAAGPVDAVWARLHVMNAAADLIGQQELRVLRGKHVFELIPNVPEPRSSAVRAVAQIVERREVHPVFTVYIAEDVPDDDAFDALRGEALTVAVGGCAPSADYHIAAPGAVLDLLDRLVTAKSAAPSR
jgi:trehalose 6-phosphate phosphatase